MLPLEVPSARTLFTLETSSPLTAVYTPKSVIPHAASLGQPFGHCPRFPTAASRRSLDRVSVPMWRVVLSDPLRVVALVSRYLTNELIRREPLPARRLPRIGRLSRDLDGRAYAVLARVSPGCPPHKVRSLTCYAPVRHSTRVRRPGLVRLACVKHAASVRPEPGSNSPKRFRTAPDERLIVYKRSEFLFFWIPLNGRKQCLPRVHPIHRTSIFNQLRPCRPAWTAGVLATQGR